VKKIVIVGLFAPTVCRVLGISSDDARANIAEDGSQYLNQDSSPVAIYSK
jgi:hypothetical protein